MKPSIFDYFAPTTLADALNLLSEHHEDGGRLLAGGQSLIPMMNLRLARPSHLIDLKGVAELKTVVPAADGGLVIGAMVRQRDAERLPLLRQHCPLLTDGLSLIGHPATRSRGTIGRSLAHADPAAELPAVVLALDADLLARGPRGERVVPASQFFRGYYTSALEPDECLSAIRFPAWPKGAGWSFMEMARRHGDFAMVGAAVVVELDDRGTISASRIVLTGMADRPVRATAAEAALVGVTSGADAFEAAGREAIRGLDPSTDIHASAAYRLHVGAVLVKRALTEATERARSAR